MVLYITEIARPASGVLSSKSQNACPPKELLQPAANDMPNHVPKATLLLLLLASLLLLLRPLLLLLFFLILVILIANLVVDVALGAA